MENGDEALAHGKDILNDRINQVDSVINELCRYRTVMQIMVLTHKHLAIIDDLQHEEIKKSVKKLFQTMDNNLIEEYLK